MYTKFLSFLILPKVHFLQIRKIHDNRSTYKNHASSTLTRFSLCANVCEKCRNILKYEPNWNFGLSTCFRWIERRTRRAREEVWRHLLPTATLPRVQEWAMCPVPAAMHQRLLLILRSHLVRKKTKMMMRVVAGVPMVKGPGNYHRNGPINVEFIS